MSINLTFGSDPEFFLRDRDGSLVSAIGRVKGTKEKKIDLGNGHNLFYDNVLAEMNVAASDSQEGSVENIRNCLYLASRNVYPNILCLGSSATYPPSECKHQDAKVFGCEPEFCAYRMEQITPPMCKDTFRSAGGHIHLGFKKASYPLLSPVNEKASEDDQNEQIKIREWGRVWVIRMLDLFVGVPSILLDNDPSSAARRRLYGKAGSHRPKDYGVEYRAIGNFWLASPKMTRLIYQLCTFVVGFVGEHRHELLWENEKKCVAYDPVELRKVIDGTDRDGASKMMELIKKHLPEELVLEVFRLCEPSLSHPESFYREWGI